MSRTYLKNVRIVDGTGAPAIENGLYVFDNIEDKFNEDVVEYVGEMDQSVLAKAGPEDAVFDLSGQHHSARTDQLPCPSGPHAPLSGAGQQL